MPFPLSGYEPAHRYSVTMQVQTTASSYCSITQHQGQWETRQIFCLQETNVPWTGMDNGLGPCQLWCLRSQEFVWISFSESHHFTLCIRSDTMISWMLLWFSAENLHHGPRIFPIISSLIQGKITRRNLGLFSCLHLNAHLPKNTIYTETKGVTTCQVKVIFLQ